MSGIAEFTPEFFDESSRAWRANKVELAEGMFRYKRNAFPVETKQKKVEKVEKVETVQAKERLRPRRSTRLAVRLRFMREVANLKK